MGATVAPPGCFSELLEKICSPPLPPQTPVPALCPVELGCAGGCTVQLCIGTRLKGM